MSGNKIDLSTNKTFPYQKSPGINFFQYPPMKNISEKECFSLEGKLALTRHVKNNSIFTIFISIPYCESRCRSCPYFKGLLPTRGDVRITLDEYVDYIITQMQKYAKTLRFSAIRCGAIYFGGGTASLLYPDQVARIVSCLKKAFFLKRNTEITLEGNPCQFTLAYLQAVKKAGINRISIGYQSCNNEILTTIGCAHNAAEAVRAAKSASKAGFKTVNMDLLYRVPGQTRTQWERDLRKAIRFGLSGISTYEYIVYPGTTMELLIARGILPHQIDQDTSCSWYLYIRDFMRKHGYIEDRKGGFSKPGHTQMYGALSYDQGCEIIGLGAGAYSFINGYQFQAPNDPDIFKKQIRNGLYSIADRLSAQATKQNLMERFVIFSFFSAVLNRVQFLERFGRDPLPVFRKTFDKLKSYGLVEIHAQKIILTDLGIKWRSNIFYEFYSEKFKTHESS